MGGGGDSICGRPERKAGAGVTELQRATLTAMGNAGGCHPDCACCRSMPLMAGRHRHATPTVSAGVWQLPCELRLLHPPASRRIHGRSIMIRRRSDWLGDNAGVLGRRYVSELRRNFPRRRATPAAMALHTGTASCAARR